LNVSMQRHFIEAIQQRDNTIDQKDKIIRQKDIIIDDLQRENEHLTRSIIDIEERDEKLKSIYAKVPAFILLISQLIINLSLTTNRTIFILALIIWLVAAALLQIKK
jgi:hypothetical protein